MDKSELKIGQRVRYVPTHAHGDSEHSDCEDGIVRSFNPHGKPFVVYDNATRGQMLTLALAEPWTAACTDPDDLVSLDCEHRWRHDVQQLTTKPNTCLLCGVEKDNA